MGISRSGYYKWLNRDNSRRTETREQRMEAVRKAHEEHPSHGYRWVAAYIRLNGGPIISDNTVYRIFRGLGIRSETRHKAHCRTRKAKDRYPNLIFSTWDCVDRPRQVIVSDMTAFHIGCVYAELTMYFDVFTKQIIAYRIGSRKGDRMQYIEGLQDVLDVLAAEGCTEPTVLHTDQGSVYASIAYNELIRDRNIARSMSRPGKPTDNPVNESLNGWIKEELFADYGIGGIRDRDGIISCLERYVAYYNGCRPSYALGYDTPDNYHKRFMKGQIRCANTFSNRVLTEVPKFVQKRLKSN